MNLKRELGCHAGEQISSSPESRECRFSEHLLQKIFGRDRLCPRQRHGRAFVGVLAGFGLEIF
jgi:hypothetical protein